ncbi:MAG: hypothetical protein FJX72_20160, partial [Armatimonadetes bacterium]|nr:hypothetical protein [Armatimonadota bacterium]
KSAVACQRIAYLVDDGVPPSRILLVSFTRTAVAELRDRIVSYAVAGDQARSVRIATIDSHAWSLRVGFDDDPLPKALGDGSYDLSVERVVQLFHLRQPDLLEFMGRLEHLIIDEAQDVVGIRAHLVLEMLRALSPECGVSVLADPAQAIYGFTTDEDESSAALGSLLDLLSSKSPRKLTERRLTKIHRTQQPELLAVFHGTREEVEGQPVISDHVDRVRARIRGACGNDFGPTTNSSLAEVLGRAADSSTLVLFRRRADVLFASSYCSAAGVDHRLRMSGAPTVVSPWIGWLFGEVIDSLIARDSFDQVWARQAERAAAPFVGIWRDECWTLLHRIAAARRPGALDLVQLRQVIARPRPPVELCVPECGITGPILGTIHASKGREADTVMLIMPSTSGRDGQGGAAALEEGRVYYVGATRARKMLIVAANRPTPVRYLGSRRIFRNLGQGRVQIEIGREGDVDRLAHFGWSNAADVQEALASCVGQTSPMEALTIPEHGYAIRLVLSRPTTDGVTRIVEVGEMSESFKQELGRIWGIIDVEKTLRPPPKIPHLYMIAVTTVGLSEEQRGSLRPPYSRSGLGLAPIVKGFPTIKFVHRRGRRGG